MSEGKRYGVKRAGLNLPFATFAFRGDAILFARLHHMGTGEAVVALDRAMDNAAGLVVARFPE